MAKARDIPELRPNMPFREAASLSLAIRAGEVWEHEARASAPDDVEGVHDMRVATRRLRAVMEIFAESFPKKRHRSALREVKRLGAALGERRDPDVMIARLRSLQEDLAAADAPGVESLVSELAARQAGGSERVARQLAAARAERLPERLRLLSAEVRA